METGQQHMDDDAVNEVVEGNGEGEALPPGWVWTTLDEVCEINPGMTWDDSFTENLPITFVPMAAVDDKSGTIFNPETRIIAEVWKGYTRFIENDVLFAKITPCMENGKAAIARSLQNGLGFGSTEFHVLRSTDAVMPEWIYHYVRQQNFRNAASEAMTGTAGQLRVPTKYLIEVSIPLPPFNEQRRIVEAIEAQFTRLDAGVAALKRLQANLKRYKAAVLKAACEGRLVAQDPNNEPASALLERILQERREKWEAEQRAKGKDPRKVKYEEPAAPDVAGLPELPEGWCWASLGDVAECLDRFRVPINKKERASREGNVPYYGANGQVGWIDDFIFNEPLVLVVEDETFTGREIPFSYRVNGKTWVNNHAHVLRPRQVIDIEFLNYALAFYPFTPLTTGTTGRKKLTQKALVEAPFALPPLSEQMRIVNEIERLLSVLDQLNKSANEGLQRAERLRQSILREAFGGRLVAQDPADEAAEVLLARIRAARAASTQATGKGKRGKSATMKGRRRQADVE